MKKQSLLAITIVVLIFLSHLAQNISAVELITNGGFETGNFTGWTIVNSSGGWRNWTVSASGAGGDDGTGYTPVPTTTVVQQGTRSAWNGVAGSNNSPYLLYQDITIPAAHSAQMTWNSRFQMNHTQFCSTACGTATYAVEVLTTSNVLLQTLFTMTAATNTNVNTGYVNRSANLSAYHGQTIRIRFRAVTTVTFAGPGQLEIDAVSVNALPVLAAEVSVGGRIQTANGNGIRNVSVALTAPDGTTRTTLTNAFGYYNFENVEVGANYIITVNSKRYTFTNPTQIISVSENVSDVDFVSIE